MKYHKIIFTLSCLVFWISCRGQNNMPIDSINKNSSDIGKNSPDIDVFINYFLDECFWDIKTDSLIYQSSPVITQFFHREIPFGRYWNPGVYCCLFTGDRYGYNFSGNDWGSKNPSNKWAEIFKETEPVDGFCEESSSKDGIYYKVVSDFPDFQDPAKEGADITTQVKIPAKFKKSKKINVKILSEKYIIASIYFIQIKNIWYLVSFDECDCSA